MVRKVHTDRQPVVDDPEGRIQAALSVTDDEPMPRVRLQTLRQDHGHLVFPFEGRLSDPVGPHRDTRSPLSVVRLLDVDDYCPEDVYGLICKAEQKGERIELPLDRIDAAEEGSNRQMLKDYRYWMANWA